MSFFEALGGTTAAPEQWRDSRKKLDDETVATIRRRYGTGSFTQVELAAEYGVSQPQISKIVNLKQRRAK